MSDAPDPRATVEEHIQAIRKIEEDLRARILERRELEPSGLLSFFTGSPDPARLEEVTFEIEILKEELQLRRTLLTEARTAEDEAEREARKTSLIPSWVQDDQAAAPLLRAIGDLQPLLTQLRSMASAASIGRAGQHRFSMRRRGGASRHMGTARMAEATAASTGNWEPVLDRVEVLADLIGMPLVLPRRYTSSARPAGSPQPPPEIAAARVSARCSSDLDFGPALETIGPRIGQAQTHCTLARAALTERFPQASTLAALLPPGYATSTARPAQAGREPGELLQEHWELLRETFQTLSAMVAARAGTMRLLDPVGQWQRTARAIHEDPVAQEHQLLPPVNDGADLGTFVRTLIEEWPALDERFSAWKATREAQAGR